MAIYSEKNLYPGINPHLNSFLQQESGGWESFHAEYVVGIARELDRILPENYYAVAKKSLQISEIGLSIEQRRTRPDISVYQVRSQAASAASPAAAVAPSMTLPLADTLEDEDDYLTGVVIYTVESGSVPGKPVTRIEMLSPANKPPQSFYRQYLAKRLQTLRSRLSLVEIDFLHETRPVIGRLPSYPDGENGAFPYTIVVSDPHPAPEDGHMHLYGFGVDDPIPVVEVPLGGDDRVALDFGAVYHRLYESVRVFKLVVDYAQEPVNFDRYLPSDRDRIRQRMAAIAKEIGRVD